MPPPRSAHRRPFLVASILLSAVIVSVTYNTTAQLLHERAEHLRDAGEAMRQHTYELGEHVTKNVQTAGMMTAAVASAAEQQAGAAPAGIDWHWLAD